MNRRKVFQKDWLSILQIPPEEIPQVLILRSTQNLKNEYDIHRRYFTDILEIGLKHPLLENAFIGSLEGLPIGYASVNAGPHAADIVRIFGSLGTQMVLLTGPCCALNDHLKPFDWFVATQAYRHEKVAQNNQAPSRIVEASFQGIEVSAFQRIKNTFVHWGRTCSTFNALRDYKVFHQDCLGLGCWVIDRVTAFVFTAAESFGMYRAALLVVADISELPEKAKICAPDKHGQETCREQLIRETVIKIVREYHRKTKQDKRTDPKVNLVERVLKMEQKPQDKVK